MPADFLPEAITAPAEGEGKFVRQSGGRGQYGHAIINIAPNGRGKGIEVENKIVGGVIEEYHNAVEAGIREAIAGDVLAGYPLVDVRVEVVDDRARSTPTNWPSRWPASLQVKL